MSLFRRKPPQRPKISWPVDRPFGEIHDIPSPCPAVYSPIASSPSADFSFASRWPLKDDVFDQNVTFPSPLQAETPMSPKEDVKMIEASSPPPLPPKEELPRVATPEEFNGSMIDSVMECGDVPTPKAQIEKEQSMIDIKELEAGATQHFENSPPPPVYRDIAPSPHPERTSSLPLYQEEADIYRYLSRSPPPMFKDDEEVYEDVYENISPMRSSRRFDNETLRPISPLRPNKRKWDQESERPFSPLRANPTYEEEYEEDLLEDLPLIRTAGYDKYDRDDTISPLPQGLYSSLSSTPLSWRSNRISDMTTSTVNTTYSTRPSDDLVSSLSPRARSNKSCADLSCDFDYEDYFEKIQHEIDISDDRPDDDLLSKAGRIPIFDSDGKGRPFSSIYSGDTAIGEQQMVIFVRHFFCGACQAYLRALTKAIPFHTYFALPKPTSITIIGLGSPELIDSYRKRTGCPFPIYSDPTKRLYKALGMNWSLRFGKNPQYMSGITGKEWVMSQVEEMNHIDERLKYRGGHMLWVGGEFLFREQEVVWCHRMKSYRGHAEIDVIKKVLDVED